MTCMLSSYMTLEIGCRHTSHIVHCFSFSSTNLQLKRRTFSKYTFLGLLSFTAFWAIDIKERGNFYRLRRKLQILLTNGCQVLGMMGVSLFYFVNSCQLFHIQIFRSFNLYKFHASYNHTICLFSPIFEKWTIKKSKFDRFQKVIFYSLPVVGQLHNFVLIIRGKL